MEPVCVNHCCRHGLLVRNVMIHDTLIHYRVNQEIPYDCSVFLISLVQDNLDYDCFR